MGRFLFPTGIGKVEVPSAGEVKLSLQPRNIIFSLNAQGVGYILAQRKLERIRLEEVEMESVDTNFLWEKQPGLVSFLRSFLLNCYYHNRHMTNV